MAIDITDLISSLKSLTREQWRDIDSEKQNKLAPTIEEIETQKLEREQVIKQTLTTILASDFGYDCSGELTKEKLKYFIEKWFGDYSEKLREYLGENEKILFKRNKIINAIDNLDDEGFAIAIRTFLRFIKEYKVN